MVFAKVTHPCMNVSPRSLVIKCSQRNRKMIFS